MRKRISNLNRNSLLVEISKMIRELEAQRTPKNWRYIQPWNLVKLIEYTIQWGSNNKPRQATVKDVRKLHSELQGLSKIVPEHSEGNPDFKLLQ